MTYKAYLKQLGGCDYTIGCGQIVLTFEADNILKVEEMLIKKNKR